MAVGFRIEPVAIYDSNPPLQWEQKMSNEWYVKMNGSKYGPISMDELKAYAKKGRIKPSTDVRQGKDGDWINSSQVPWLQETMAAGEQKEPFVALPIIGHIYGVATVIVFAATIITACKYENAMIFAIGAISALLIWGAGELIFLLLAIEKNTRRTAEMLEIAEERERNKA